MGGFCFSVRNRLTVHYRARHFHISKSKLKTRKHTLRTCNRRFCIVPVEIKFWENIHGWSQDACVLCAGVLSEDCESITAPQTSVWCSCSGTSCASSPPEHVNQQNVTSAPDSCVERTKPRVTASGLSLPACWKSLLSINRSKNWAWSCSFTPSCPRVYCLLSATFEILRRVSICFSLAHFSSAGVCGSYAVQRGQ